MLKGLLRRLLAVALLCVAVGSAGAAPARRVIILSWDGAADWVVDRMLAANQLPNVARLAQMGARAEYAVPMYPSITACGHAAIWTGAYGDVNGITGNAVPVLPRAEHTLLERRSGFSSASLRAEPIYFTAARAGKKVAVLSATQSYPPDPYLAGLRAANVPTDRLVSFSGFESPITEDGDGAVWDAKSLRPAEGWTAAPPHNGAMKELSLPIGEQTFYVLAYDDPNDPVGGLDTLLIREGSKEPDHALASATLKPAEAAENTDHFSPPFRVTKGPLVGYAYFRLFSLAPDGSGMTLYQRGVNGLRGAASREETEKYLAAYGGFHSAPFDPYERGELGKTFWQGGDGAAERRLLECIRLDYAFLKRAVRYALKRWNPDLLIDYSPMTDAAGHLWMGVLDPQSPRYDRALAEKLWPYYAQVYQLADDWLGDVLTQMGRDTVVCLVSDHGMRGAGKEFSPNAVLEKAGLAARGTDGSLDLARTQICAPPWGDYFLVVNGTDWKGGIVLPEDRERILRAATEALLAATDPETGQHIVTRVFRPAECVGLGMGGEAGGDLYFDLAPGYTTTGAFLPSGVRWLESPIGGGEHGYFPYGVKMQAICFFGGAGVRPETRLAGIRQIDIAPTLAYLLGIPTPKDARGHVLGEALRAR